jgi:hypothetical protein
MAPTHYSHSLHYHPDLPAAAAAADQPPAALLSTALPLITPNLGHNSTSMHGELAQLQAQVEWFILWAMAPTHYPQHLQEHPDLPAAAVAEQPPAVLLQLPYHS